MRTVFHVLPEGERFSEFQGGAIGRWVANILREDRNGVVLAGSADTTWYPSETVIPMVWLRAYGALQWLAGGSISWPWRKRMLQAGFAPVLQRVRAGDVVWVHDRPEFAAAVGELVHDAGGTVVLHMHQGNLPQVSEAVLNELCADRIVFAEEDRLAEGTLETAMLGFQWGLMRLRYEAIVNRMPHVQRIFAEGSLPAKRRGAGVLQSARG